MAVCLSQACLQVRASGRIPLIPARQRAHIPVVCRGCTLLPVQEQQCRNAPDGWACSS